MKATQLLHNLGQSLWLDNITRDLLNNGRLKSYLDELSVTGLTSNPTIFDQAIKKSTAYDAAILDGLEKARSSENLFFDLALDDLTKAADLFRTIYDRTNGVDGWVSLEVSPLLAHDTAQTIAAARQLFARAGRPNLFIKIPGTPEGLPAIEEAIFAGVPVNVTLLFSREHYLAAAEAYLRGIERRMDAGLNPNVGSVASVFISRWDSAVAGKVPALLHNRLGIAIAGRTYKAYRDLLASPRWQRSYNARCAAPTPFVGKHGNQGPESLRRSLRQVTRRAVYRQYHARGDVESPGGSRRAGFDHGGGRRRLRVGLRAVRPSRYQRGESGREVTRRRREVIRKILERTAGSHRIQKHRTPEGCLRLRVIL
jgi:transaldolase